MGYGEGSVRGSRHEVRKVRRDLDLQQQEDLADAVARLCLSSSCYTHFLLHTFPSHAGNVNVWKKGNWTDCRTQATKDTVRIIIVTFLRLQYPLIAGILSCTQKKKKTNTKQTRRSANTSYALD